MNTAILVLTIISMSTTVIQNEITIIKGLKVVHHHTTRPLYRHVVKPVAVAVKHEVAGRPHDRSGTKSQRSPDNDGTKLWPPAKNATITSPKQFNLVEGK